MFGFALGWFPPDFIEKSKMKDVGFIAFNVLVVHSGTMLDFGKLKTHGKAIVLCCTAVLAVTAVVSFGIAPFIGKELALISPGPVVGGGAACAIASNSLLAIRPGLAAYPWLLFMVQGFFGIPLCAWAMGKDARGILAESRKSGATASRDRGREFPPVLVGEGLCGRIPEKYKGTAYYLGLIMIVSVFNRWLSTAFLARLGLGMDVTALLFGIALGQLRIIDRDPLQKSDSMGFLMLGLMALMGNALAKTPPAAILSLIPVVLLVFSVSSIVLVATGIVAGKVLKFSAYRGITLAVNCMVGFPFIATLVKATAVKTAGNGEERDLLESRLMPPLAAGSMLIGNVVSIFLASFVAALL
ncbi:MAG: hypothetical protein NT080_00010 [Spirochaetes bacterium]|nr:hypothetical protein [Spirochaetota bacterium]